MTKDSYIQQMTPYAKKASQQLGGGVHWQTILSQWALETAWGKSAAAKKNNHAGIKDFSKGKDYDAGTYAGYNSLDRFVNDYVRVMNLNYYDKVRQQGPVMDDFEQLHLSPWAEDKNYKDKLISVYQQIGDKEPTSSNKNVTLLAIGGIVLLALLS